MKTIKQKLLMIAVLFFSFIMLISVGLMPREASATEGTFSTENFEMCKGAEVRTDGDASGIRFVAKLGDTLPEYENLTYNMMIVPNAYIAKYNAEGALNDNWYEGLKEALEADETVANKTIISMQTAPFYSNEVVVGEEGYYIRGTLSNVKYDNINIEWFGMGYLTYTNLDGETEYVYANITEEGTNVRNLVYCASGYLNVYDYSSEEKAAEKEVLTNFVAQGINKAAGNVTEENKNDRTYLNQGIQAIEESVSETVNMLPEDTASWTTGVPAGVKLHVVYGAEDNGYASIDQAGVITGILGDNNAQTTKNVTMKVLGKTYEKPVHVYTVKAEIAEETVEIFSKGGTFGGEEFNNSAELAVTAHVDGVPVENAIWASTDTSVATVEDGEVVAEFKEEMFESETVSVSFSFEFAGKTFESNKCSVKVSFPVAYKTAPFAYGDLIQKVFNEENVLVETKEEIKLDNNFGTVTSFKSVDGAKELLVDGKTNANVYGAQEAGEKEFIVVSANGYAYKVKATVVNYAIGNEAQLFYFFESYKTATVNDETNPTIGTYVVLSTDFSYTKGHAVNTKSTFYCGTFDGRGHAITLSYDAYKWFFGRDIGAEGVIKNTAFLGLKKTTAAGGGLAHVLSGTVDNCYIEIIMKATDKACGGVCYKNEGTIANTIVNVTSSASTTVSNKATLCCSGTATSNTDFDTCFSIGVADKVIYAAATKTNNVVLSADELKDKIGTALPTSYNSHWNYTDTGLWFGNAQVLTFSVAE